MALDDVSRAAIIAAMKVLLRRYLPWLAGPYCRPCAWIAGAALTAFILIVAGGLLPDAGLRWGVVHVLRKIGMAEVALGEAEVEIFGGRVALRGLGASPPAGGGGWLQDFALDFAWGPLWQRRIQVDAAAVKGLRLDIARLPNGSFEIGGLPIAATKGEGGGGWSLALEDVQLQEGAIHYRDGDQRIEIAIESFTLTALREWEPDQPAHFTLKGRIADAPVTISGEMTPFAAMPSLSFVINIDGVPLTSLGPLQKWMGLDSWKGNFAAQGQGSFALEESAPHFKLELNVTLASPDVRSAQFSFAAEKLTFSGAVEQKGQFVQASGLLAATDAQTAIGAEKMTAKNAEWAFDSLRMDMASHANETKGRLRFVELAWQAEGREARFDDLSWQGHAAFDWRSGAIRAEGALAGNGLAASIADRKIGAKKLALAVAPLTASLQAEADRRFVWQGNLKADGLRYDGDGVKIAPMSASWEGETAGALGNATIQLRGALSVAGLQADQGAQRLRIVKAGLRADPVAVDWAKDAKIDWSGSLSIPELRWSDAQMALQMDGVTSGGQLHLGDKMEGEAWLKAAQVQAHDASGEIQYLNGERVAVQGLRIADGGALKAERVGAESLQALRQGRVGPGARWRLETSNLRFVEPVRAASGAISVEALEADDLTLRLARDESGWAERAFFSQKDASKTKDASLLEWRIGRVDITSGRAVLADRTFDPSLRFALGDLSVHLGALSSREPAKSTPFRLAARMGDFGRINFSGSLAPLAEPFGGQITGKLETLDLPPLSPYATRALGVGLTTGQLGADLEIGAQAGKLNGAVNLFLADLSVETPNGPEARLAQDVGVPVETVVGLLQDSDGNIRLRIPVGGNVTDPQFDLSDAVAQAVGGALRDTLATTVNILFPLAPMISIIMDAENTAHLGLQPMIFPAGQTQPTDQHVGYLATLGRLLKERPATRIKLCGIATFEDWRTLKEMERKESVLMNIRGFLVDRFSRKGPEADAPDPETLQRLAGQRSRALRQILVEAEGIDPARLFECHPKVELEGEAKPRVDLLL